MEWKWMVEHWYVFFILGLVAFCLCIMWGNEKKNTIRSKRWQADEYPEHNQNHVEHGDK